MARLAMIDGVMRPSARLPVTPPMPPMPPSKPPAISPLRTFTPLQTPHVRAPGELKSVSRAYDPSLPPQFRNAPQLMQALIQASAMAFRDRPPEQRPTAVELIRPAAYVPARPSLAISSGAPVIARKQLQLPIPIVTPSLRDDEIEISEEELEELEELEALAEEEGLLGEDF